MDAITNLLPIAQRGQRRFVAPLYGLLNYLFLYALLRIRRRAFLC